jgi:hypothetical protein
LSALQSSGDRNNADGMLASFSMSAKAVARCSSRSPATAACSAPMARFHVRQFRRPPRTKRARAPTARVQRVEKRASRISPITLNRGQAPRL